MTYRPRQEMRSDPVNSISEAAYLGSLVCQHSHPQIIKRLDSKEHMSVPMAMLDVSLNLLYSAKRRMLHGGVADTMLDKMVAFTGSPFCSYIGPWNMSISSLGSLHKQVDSLLRLS